MNPLFSPDGTNVLMTAWVDGMWVARAWPWLLAASLGAALLAPAVIKAVLRKQARWRPVTAQVTACKVLVLAGWVFKSYKTVRVRYCLTYAVNGTTYHSVCSVTERKASHFNARQHARNAVRDGQLRVYYCEDAPERTLLRPPQRRQRDGSPSPA